MRNITSRQSAGHYTCMMDVTAYTKDCGGSGRTALGRRAQRGVIAVDPREIPLGTPMYVEGYGKGYAGDIGRSMHGRRIDICFSNRLQALKWGRRKVRVTVYR